MEETSEKLRPGQAEEERAKSVTTYDGRQMTARPTVAGAVRQMSTRMPAVKPKGVFRHPAEWEQEELDFIADCLKQNIPIYTIANMVHCERHTLSKLIESRPELLQLKEDKYENLLDEAEYQADRLMKAGNSAIVIHVLNTLGRKRGWGEEESPHQPNEDRIVMGLIPEDEVAEADGKMRELQKDVAVAPIDPLKMALTEESVRKEVDRRMKVVEADGSSSSPLRQDGGSLVEMSQMEEVEGYMQIGGIPNNTPSAGDPWADGANSVFFQ